MHSRPRSKTDHYAFKATFKDGPLCIQGHVQKTDHCAFKATFKDGPLCIQGHVQRRTTTHSRPRSKTDHYGEEGTHAHLEPGHTHNIHKSEGEVQKQVHVHKNRRRGQGRSYKHFLFFAIGVRATNYTANTDLTMTSQNTASQATQIRTLTRNGGAYKRRTASDVDWRVSNRRNENGLVIFPPNKKNTL